MTLPAHAQNIARHFEDKSQQLEDITALCEHLLPDVSDQHAKAALEWIALRLPVKGALSQEYNISENSLECARRIENIVSLLVQRADLSLPIEDEDVKQGLDNTDKSLGSVLLSLGHTVEMGQLSLPEHELPSIARTAVDHGDYPKAMNVLSLVLDQSKKEDLIDTMWLTLARSRTTESLEGSDILPDPPETWWTEVQSSRISTHGDEIAQRVLLDRPHLLCKYVQGALLGGNIATIHPSMLKQAQQEQSLWDTGEGWKGSMVCALVARAGNEDIAWAGNMGQITSSLPNALALSDDTPMPKVYITRLLSACASNFTADQMSDAFSETLKGLSPQSTKKNIEEVGRRWEDYPRGKYEAISPGLCVLTGRAMVKWAGKKNILSSFIEMTRNAYEHASFQLALQNEDQEAIQCQARSVKLLLSAVPKVEKTLDYNTSEEEKSQHLEFLIWQFASERLGRKAKGNEKKLASESLTSRQLSMVVCIDALVESGTVPSWNERCEQIAMQLLSNPVTNMPHETLSKLQRLHLNKVPTPDLPRRGVRL